MIQLKALENGLRIATCHIPHVETISMGVWVDVGSRYEDVQQGGIAHFLEHMVFKGTKTRSAFDIVSEIESVGGDLNAATSQEMTCYYVTLLQKDWRLGVEILGDIVQNSIFPPDELLREKDVVLQEIDQTEDAPDEVLFELAQNIAFPNQGLGRPILGTKQSVAGLRKQDLDAFVQTHYVGKNMVFAAAGQLDAEALKDHVTQVFGALPVGTTSVPQAAVYKDGTASVKKPLEQTHIYYGLPGVSITHPDFYALQLYATILGGGMSSRLFQEIREKRGLVYGISAFSTSYRDTGLLNIYTSTSVESPQTIIQLIQDEMKKAEVSLREEELIAAKSQLKAGLMMSYESTLHWIGAMARQILHLNKFMEPKELLRAIDETSLTDLRRVASGLAGTKSVQAWIGP